MIDVVWDNAEKNIIRIDYYEPVSWEGYRQSVNQARDMAQSVDNTVHIIHNAGHVKMPSDEKLRAIEELSITLNTVPENAGVIVSVTLSTFERRITQIISRVLLRVDNLHFYMVDSLEKAYSLIQAFEDGENLQSIT